MSEALLHNTNALYFVAQQLADEGRLLTLLNLITSICGLALVVFTLVDIRRQRMWSYASVTLLIVGLIGMVAGFRLLGMVGTPIGLDVFSVAGDDTTQIILVEAKRLSGGLAALAVVGLTSGMIYASLAVGVLYVQWRRVQRKGLKIITRAGAI